MTGPSDGDDLHDLLARPAAAHTVGDGIGAAVAAGRLTDTGPGRWRLNTVATTPSPWIKESRDASRHCRFYMRVMFEHVYARARVPAGCAGCYKVKVVPRTLRELMAVRDIARALPHTYKCGLDLPTPVTSGPYGGYFYLNGLDAARAAYGPIREAVSGQAKLGPAVPVFIKRGCTEYEMACGPSDSYAFDPAQLEIEAGLRPRIMLDQPPRKPAAVETQQTFAHWIRTAYSIGDDTYRDFTGGRRLYPEVVRYDP